jgi:hypothetical protein
MERPHVCGCVDRAVRQVFYTVILPELEAQRVRRRDARGEIARSINCSASCSSDNWQELRRESLLRDLHQRIPRRQTGTRRIVGV